MDWVWQLYEPYIRKELRRLGNEEPSPAELQETFIKIMSESSVTVLVQEPWQNAVRFKGLAKYDALSMMPLLTDPMNYLAAHFGGGKFKLNFHQGLNFIATKNFKPEGEAKWQDLPDIGY
jgi:hypothetical protein